MNESTPCSIREIMESKSVVIFGASPNEFKPGSLLIEALRNSGFKGQVAGINPKGGELKGRALYPSLADVPFVPDLAVMIIPPKLVPGEILNCADKGVKGVVISTEGFAETGDEGRALQDEIRSIFKKTGLRGFGPNTLGIVNTETGLTTSYFLEKEMLAPGGIGVAAQSGIFVGAFLRYLGSHDGLQVSKGIGLGNKVDVDECDALDYFANDEQTRLVGMYLEDVRDGRRFLDVASSATARKPVILVKGGRTEAGGRAIASHTAGMAGNDAVFDGAMRQAGVIRLDGLDDFVRTLTGFAWMPLPKGKNLAVVTYSGAQAIISIDTATELGLEAQKFGSKTLERVSRVISTPGKAGNPIDIFPDMNVHGFEKTSMEIMNALLDDDAVHGVIFISFALWGSDMHQPVAELISQKRNKPVFFALLGSKEDVRTCGDDLRRRRLPVYLFPETAVRVFEKMYRQSKRMGLAD